MLQHEPHVLLIELKNSVHALDDVSEDNLSSSALPGQPLANRLLQLLEALALVFSIHVLVADVRQDGAGERMILEYANLVAVLVNTRATLSDA